MLVACGTASRDDRLRVAAEAQAQVAAVTRATIPSDVQFVERSGPTRTQTGVEAEWSFVLLKAWPVYAKEVSEAMKGAGYVVVGQADESLAFSKHVPGDTYRVAVVRAQAASGIRATVQFFAAPD